MEDTAGGDVVVVVVVLGTTAESRALRSDDIL